MAKKPAEAAFAHPSNLSFERSLNPGLFFLYGRAGEQLLPVPVAVTTLRGTISNHIKDPSAAARSDEGNPANANPQSIERAYLPAGTDTLVVKGEIRILNGVSQPVSCNTPGFLAAHRDFVRLFAEKDGFLPLAERYLMNLINGRILWRNCKSDRITVRLSGEGFDHVFNANAIEPARLLAIDGLPETDRPAAHALARRMADALAGVSGPASLLRIRIEASAVLGEGMEVYPSQEFAEEKSSRNGRPVGKVLARVALPDGTQQAVIHDQKIGNAIRTIDTWYAAHGEFAPIPVEPYGSSVKEARAWRIDGESRHFYELLAELPELTAGLERDGVNAEHLYYMAVLIRGGLFGKKSDKKGIQKHDQE